MNESTKNEGKKSTFFYQLVKQNNSHSKIKSNVIVGIYLAVISREKISWQQIKKVNPAGNGLLGMFCVFVAK